jgi:hypothetical protein
MRKQIRKHESDRLETVHVNEPGDRYEEEARRVAEAVDTAATFDSVSRQGSLSGPVPAASALGLGAGAPMSAEMRRDFEPRFGHDFSSVRIHTDDGSAAVSRELGARAFTVGEDVAFGPGRYAPHTQDGRQLIAHELTHVVQQRQGQPAVQLDPEGWSGPSYARKGPAGSAVEDRRTATASPAAFTAEYDNACLDGAIKIGKGVKTLYDVATDIEKRADSGTMWKANDKDLLALAKQVRDVAKGLQGMKEGFETLRKKGFDFSKTDFSSEPELPKTLDLLKGSIGSVTQAVETNESLAAFQANPNRQTANAWANSVTKQFSAAKGFLGAIKLPPGLGWIKDYWEGLLGAPAAYVGAFQELSARRYDQIDDEAGIANNDSSLYDMGSGKTVWKGGGPVQELVANAYTAPNGLALYQWITSHTKLQGLDLRSAPPLALAKALIISGLNDDKDVSADDKAKWTAWVGNFQPAEPKPTS